MIEAEPLSLPERPRARRTQVERRAETRARILDATVESINEIGYQRTTSAEISRRSGVTWGAVQHHFGGKDGILGAILENSFNHFSAGLSEAFETLPPNASMARRIDRFIDAAWDHFGSARYRASFEILLATSVSREADSRMKREEMKREDLSWQGEILKAWTRVWRRLFPELELGRRRTLMIQHYTISTLSGLASMQRLAGEAPPFLHEELTLLKKTLAREFRNGRSKCRESD